MNTRLKAFAEQILVVLNIFIVFLLLFENKIILPYWLQPVGRMHPLLLHFPIVLLILGIVSDIYRFKKEKTNAAFYTKLSGLLLLSGAILSGITVIMGLFLSREEGYDGEAVAWHKWFGASVFFIASIVYWIRNKNWYSRRLSWSSALLLMPFLLVTGHYGADITHGDNYLLQPITAHLQRPAVSLEEAIVFNDLIQPILEAKCTGCHNPRKLKGELSLMDSLSITKGGKTGKLFVPGNPDISLILERVHLPPEDEKHMPPDGKPQLTAAEIRLLTLWIRNDVPFSQKVITLPEDDSLRMLAATLLKPAEEEKFDFPAADEALVSRLNTNYRTISPLAKESPALSVNIYNRSAYTPAQLQELSEIEQQVVSLNLNKMPVKDEDLKTVAKFKNLRRLDLNFTDITTTGLDALIPLQELKTLTLSGTKLNYDALAKKLASFKALKTISVWNTSLSVKEMDALQKSYSQIKFIEGFVDDGKNPLKLNPPQVKNASMIFANELPVQLMHPVKGTQIRFTTDGSEPDTLHSPVFDGKTTIAGNTVIRARACKDGWYASDPVTFNFFKNTFIPDSVRLLFPLNSVHQAEGAQTFFNTKLGVIGANNPAWANNWAGVRNNDMALVAMFYKPVTVSSVGLHYMLEAATGIFPPATVEVWGGENEDHLQRLLVMKPPMPAKGEPASLKIVEGSFKPHTVSVLKIIAKPCSEKDRKKLLLVDEMFLN
jgi:uncharacterized membrane protein